MCVHMACTVSVMLTVMVSSLLWAVGVGGESVQLKKLCHAPVQNEICSRGPCGQSRGRIPAPLLLDEALSKSLGLSEPQFPLGGQTRDNWNLSHSRADTRCSDTENLVSAPCWLSGETGSAGEEEHRGDLSTARPAFLCVLCIGVGRRVCRVKDLECAQRGQKGLT